MQLGRDFGGQDDATNPFYQARERGWSVWGWAGGRLGLGWDWDGDWNWVGLGWNGVGGRVAWGGMG